VLNTYSRESLFNLFLAVAVGSLTALVIPLPPSKGDEEEGNASRKGQALSLQEMLGMLLYSHGAWQESLKLFYLSSVGTKGRCALQQTRKTPWKLALPPS
jgi:hypothetical protein